MARTHSSRSRAQNLVATAATTTKDDDEPTTPAKKYPTRKSTSTPNTRGKKSIINSGPSTPRVTRVKVKAVIATKTKAAKKKRKNANLKDEQEIISEERWRTMRAFGSFIVNHPKDEEEEYKFSKEDIVAILPHGRSPDEILKPWEYWIAKIRDVRAEIHDDGAEEHNTVYVKVQWFYSGSDVGDVVKSFDVSAIPPYERIFSDHYDILEPQTVDGIIPITKYDESDPEPAYIPRDRFFRRYTLEYKLRKVQPKTLLCTCNKAYNPADRSPASLMHFCPRPSCRRGYHSKCLGSSRESSGVRVNEVVNGEAKDVPRKSARKHASPVKKAKARVRVGEEGETSVGLTPRALRLLACSPDTDQDVDLAGLIPRRREPDERLEGGNAETTAIRLEPPRKKQRPSSSSSAAKTSAPTLAQLLSGLPSGLLAVATQPQVRGGAFWEGGVSGNVGLVTRARRLVYEYLSAGDEGVLDDWEETVFGFAQEEEGEDESEVEAEHSKGRNGKAKREARGGKRPTIENAIVRVDGDGSVEPFVCPACKSAI